jgi:hypothetical protein
MFWIQIRNNNNNNSSLYLLVYLCKASDKIEHDLHVFYEFFYSKKKLNKIDFILADIYEAIYPYEATDPADLSFNIGQHIVVLKREGDWWTGQIGDRTGTFPNNYVKKIETVNFEEKKKFFFVLLFFLFLSHY